MTLFRYSEINIFVVNYGISCAFVLVISPWVSDMVGVCPQQVTSMANAFQVTLISWAANPAPLSFWNPGLHFITLWPRQTWPFIANHFSCNSTEGNDDSMIKISTDINRWYLHQHWFLQWVLCHAANTNYKTVIIWKACTYMEMNRNTGF